MKRLCGRPGGRNFWFFLSHLFFDVSSEVNFWISSHFSFSRVGDRISVLNIWQEWCVLCGVRKNEVLVKKSRNVDFLWLWFQFCGLVSSYTGARLSVWSVRKWCGLNTKAEQYALNENLDSYKERWIEIRWVLSNCGANLKLSMGVWKEIRKVVKMTNWMRMRLKRIFWKNCTPVELMVCQLK